LGDLRGEIVGNMSTGADYERVPAVGTRESAPGFRGARVVDERGAVPIGTVIADKYRVERVLGEGAMGIVLAARHLELDELVAIKCIRAQMPWSPDVIARFAREAKASARLKSEHIAKVIDVGVSPPVGPYMVMEYLEGEDLAAVLKRRGPLPVRRAAEYLMQICEALAHAHAASIIHRDVKPENLFLTRHGELELMKVLDFGISKAPQAGRVFGGEISVKETSVLMGTPLYMSPEQIRSTREVDHRSDIWSLGVVMFELLTGRPAFAAETVTQVCALVLEAATPPLAEHCENAPPALAAIIERCLMKDPAQRYQSAAELANALLPFAPPRARLHAERATAVLRFADPNGGEPLPSTLPEGRRPRDTNLGTDAPTVLGAGIPTRGGYRASTLAVIVASIICLGLGFVGYRGLRGSGDASARQAAALVPPATSPGDEKPGRSEAPETKAHPPTIQPAEGATPRTAPALTNPKLKPETARARGKARAPVAPSPPVKVAASEPAAAPVPETKSADGEQRAPRPRARLLDEQSPVRLLE
jgi:eukaryotic-like serine/threonine-protein kinase